LGHPVVTAQLVFIEFTENYAFSYEVDAQSSCVKTVYITTD